MSLCPRLLQVRMLNKVMPLLVARADKSCVCQTVIFFFLEVAVSFEAPALADTFIRGNLQ